jgi:hypothetical protein
MRRVLAAAVLAAILSQVAIGSCAAAGWFAPWSFWNRRLPPRVPLAANSAGYVGDLVRQLGVAAPWINTGQYSVPVYRVGREMPTKRVSIVREDGSWVDPRLRRAFARVPIPGRAQASGGSDAQLVIWQPSRDRMWEFIGLRRDGSRWTAWYGGAMRHVSRNPGFYDGRAWRGAQGYWGATATGLPLVGGLMTIPELSAHRIEHALAIAIPEPSPRHVWPAVRSDGFLRTRDAIPEGTIFRLPAGLDVESLGLPPVTRAIALAAQEYGLVVRDKSGAVVLYAEDPGPTGREPYPRLFEGREPSELLRDFPWSKLEAVRPGWHPGA